jgi:Fe2+ or Zn2+ uptake regulation protein
MNTFVKETLKTHQLRNTTCREEVIGLFHRKAIALSHSDLESNLGNLFDRVTLYRTLKTFVEKGILHLMTAVCAMPSVNKNVQPMATVMITCISNVCNAEKPTAWSKPIFRPCSYRKVIM